MAGGNGFYRASATPPSSHLAGAQAAQARAFQSEFATMFPVWYRPSAHAHGELGGKGGHGRKAKKPKQAPKRARHATPMASGSTRDPFKRVGMRQG